MSEAQDSKETPRNFLIRALDLRQKILFASQSSLKYDPILVQNMFLHTVLTGLQNGYIRGDLKPYLQQTDVSDELLLEKVNIACMTEAERQSKKKTTVQHRPMVHSVECTDVAAPTEKKGKMLPQENKNKHSSDLLNEIREIKSDVALLKNLSAEVSQIRESIQLPQASAAQNLSTPGLQNNIPANQIEYSSPAYWPKYSPGQRGRTAQFQQGFAPQRHFMQPRSRPRRCLNCQQSETDMYCTHCYRCGSSEHFLAGCRVRTPNLARDGNLNEGGLLPWDRK